MRVLLVVVAMVVAAPAWGAPERLAVGAISLDGQITLTPGFSPDGQTVWFAQSACAEIGECPQRLTRAVKRNGVWQKGEPVALAGDGMAANGTPARVDFPSVTPDGRSLLFS